jgi:TolB protein
VVTNTRVSPSLGDYSPTGKEITYTDYEGYNDNDEEIYTINVGGGGRFQVTDNNTEDFDPSYSPDGKKIIHSSWDGRDTEIFTISVHGGDKAKVTESAFPSYSPAVRRSPTQGAADVTVRSMPST